MNNFQFICPYSPLFGEINFNFPDTVCSSDSATLDPISFSGEEFSVYLLNEIHLPFDFYSGSTSEVTWNDFLTLDISVGESYSATWNEHFLLDFYSGEESFDLISDTFELGFYFGSTSEVTWNDFLTFDFYDGQESFTRISETLELDFYSGEESSGLISDTFEFDFYSGEESFALISDTFEFDFFDGNSTVFLVSLFRPVDFQFPCEYLIPHGEVNFKFPDDECSSFYESVTGSSSEIDLSIFSVLNFDIIEGTIFQIDLKTDRKNNLTCLLIPFEVATLGVTGDPLTIAQMGLGVTCQSLSFYSDEVMTFDFILSESESIELTPLIYSGEYLELDLNTEKTEVFNFEFRNGESLTFNLYNVNRGGSNLEVIDVIDINDSRRKISFSLTVNNKKITSEFHIDSISFSRANVSVKNVKIKKQTISVICEVIKRTIQPISVKISSLK